MVSKKLSPIYQNLKRSCNAEHCMGNNFSKRIISTNYYVLRTTHLSLSVNIFTLQVKLQSTYQNTIYM